MADGLIVPASVLRARDVLGARSCLQCVHHAKEGTDSVCRRYPPQVTVILVPQPPPRVNQLAPQPFATFPPVVPAHPCGEWVARLDS